MHHTTLLNVTYPEILHGYSIHVILHGFVSYGAGPLRRGGECELSEEHGVGNDQRDVLEK